MHPEVFRGEMLWCLKLKSRYSEILFAGAAYWQGTQEALSFCKRTALQSRPTVPRYSRSWVLGPASPDSSPGTWGSALAFSSDSRSLCSVCWCWLSFMEAQLGAHRQAVRRLFHTLNSLFPTRNEVEREAWIMAEPSQVQLTSFSGRLTAYGNY